MGVVLVLRKVSGDDLEELHRNPKKIVRFLFGKEPDKNLFELLKDFFSSFKPKDSSTLAPEKEWMEPADNEETDLDKAWQALHFLFTGTLDAGNPPASYLLHGKPVGNIEVGWSEPATSLDVQQVQEFNEFLKNIDRESLIKKYDPEKMNELDVYPCKYSSIEDDPEDFEYIWEKFEFLKKFVRQRAEEKSAIILYVC